MSDACCEIAESYAHLRHSRAYDLNGRQAKVELSRLKSALKEYAATCLASSCPG